MKEWIEKRLKEMKSDNVIPLHNWKEYYNIKIKLYVGCKWSFL